MEKELEVDKMHLVNEFSEIIAGIHSEEALNEIIMIFIAKLKKQTLKEIHPMILNSLCNNICAKVLIIMFDKDISKQVNEFVEYMNDQMIMPAIYKSYMDQFQLKFYDTLYQIRKLEEGVVKVAADASDAVPRNQNNQLNLLLNMDSKAERYINKNFGYSLLDLNGDFIWCDPNCEKFFEFKFKEITSKNFFDMMIPFSKNFLIQKFGDELFKNINSVGTSIAFSYVIYSMNSLNKFLKCIKKLSIETPDEFHHRLKSKCTADSIYHQYLKALSSRASLVLLKFTRGELKGIVSNQKYNFRVTQSLDDIIRNMPPVVKKIKKRGRKPMFRDELKDEANSSRKSKNLKISTKQEEPNLKDQNEGNYSDDEETIIRTAILLETRLAMNVPQFDYRKLSEDPIIKGFEEKIIKKVCNN
jgi:hypothetical protein